MTLQERIDAALLLIGDDIGALQAQLNSTLTNEQLRASPVDVKESGNLQKLFVRIISLLKSPAAFDRSLNRTRVTAAVESGTITTVTTVTTINNMANLSLIDGHQGRTLMLAANRQSWALNVRSRIS